MSEASSAAPVADVQWYTPARKVPRYIGRPPGGGTYPGGPYTIPQFVGGALVFALLAFTEGTWGGSNWLVNKFVIVAATGTYVGLAKVIKPGGRAPWVAAPAYVSAVAGTPHGRYRGKRMRPTRPHTARHGRVHVCLDGVPSARAEREPLVAKARAAAPAGRPPRQRRANASWSPGAAATHQFLDQKQEIA